MPKKKVFICFDYDHDRNYRHLLSALNANARSDISFDDLTPEEIQSYNVGRIKAVLTGKIRSATHTLVIIGSHSNSYHRDRELIGERNWQWWEIEKSKDERKGLIAVKINSNNTSPVPILNAGAVWAYSFNVPAILQAIDSA